jgi:hypothetical protein
MRSSFTHAPQELWPMIPWCLGVFGNPGDRRGRIFSKRNVTNLQLWVVSWYSASRKYCKARGKRTHHIMFCFQETKKEGFCCTAWLDSHGGGTLFSLFILILSIFVGFCRQFDPGLPGHLGAWAKAETMQKPTFPVPQYHYFSVPHVRRLSWGRDVSAWFCSVPSGND